MPNNCKSPEMCLLSETCVPCAICPNAKEKADDRLALKAGSAYAVRVTRLSVLPPKEPLFSEQCTHITIVDEAAGEYLEIEQQSGSVDVKAQTIMVTPEEWPALKQAVETLLAEIHGQNETSAATGSERNENEQAKEK
jgi:hypothetical protein